MPYQPITPWWFGFKWLRESVLWIRRMWKEVTPP
jgi:hypothetical protein